MINHCKSTLATFSHSFLLFLFIIIMTLLSFPFLIQKLPSTLTTLFIINLEYFISIDFFNSLFLALEDNANTKKTINNKHVSANPRPTQTTTKKRPALSIDTSTHTNQVITPTNKNDVLKDTTTMMMDSPDTIQQLSKLVDHPKSVITRKRHYSVSSSHSDVMDFLPPTLSPTSSVSSFSSNWSTDSKRSRVEEMIYLFETGGHHHLPHRRYSMDSYNFHRKHLYIRERKFEYKPIVTEWKKRITHNSCIPMIQLYESKSTPIRRTMAPIPEKSKSTWA